MALLAFQAVGQSQTGQTDAPANPNHSPNPNSDVLPAGDRPARSSHLVVTTPSLTRMATLHSSGEQIETEWQTVWRPMCNSRPGALTHEQLLSIAQKHQAIFTEQSPEIVVGDEQGGIAGGSFNVIFELDGSVPDQALDVIEDVEAYLEGLFDDPISIKINVDFDNLESGTLGVSGFDSTHITWTQTRSELQSGMDDSDSLQNHLPTGSKIKVRYNGNSATVTNESRVFWTLANFKAGAGSISGDAGSLTFNTDVSWDYNPANGVSGYSFQDVLVHEVGHVLGFSSGADFLDHDMQVLDIYRFQKSGGGQDYNPDNAAEFKVRPRLVSYNSPGSDDCISDVISYEYRMSDGDPYQCSHFREQSGNIGLMDPALGAGVTYFSSFFTTADLKMFDAIGYDR